MGDHLAGGGWLRIPGWFRLARWSSAHGREFSGLQHPDEME